MQYGVTHIGIEPKITYDGKTTIENVINDIRPIKTSNNKRGITHNITIENLKSQWTAKKV